MPKSVELYLVLKAMDPLKMGDAGPASLGVLSDAPPPRGGADASEAASADDSVAHVPPRPAPPAAALVLGPGKVAHVPPWPPAPMHVAAIVDHLPPKPPAAMQLSANVGRVPPKPPAPRQHTKAMAESASAQAHAQAQAPSASTPGASPTELVPATVLSVALDDEPLLPPKSLRIQSVTIYGSREVALAWLKSVDGQVFAEDAQALQLLRISADDDA